MPSKRTLTTPIISRGERKVKLTVKMYDFYKLSVFSKYTREQYTNLISDFYKAIRDLIINKDYEYKFHHRLGNLKIIKYLPVYMYNPLLPDGSVNMKGMQVDWGKTNVLWKERPELKAKKIFIYFDNKHSDEYKYMVFWDKHRMNFINNQIYRFEKCRTFRLLLGQSVLSGHDYLMKPLC